jgi:large subunit ribosomal protein L2
MAVRKYKPTTPGRRGASVSSFEEITRGKPERSLVAKGRNRAGRNSQGRVTTRHQGGGNKRRYRVIDFRRDKDGVPAKVAHIEYDRTAPARIALLHYAMAEALHLSPNGLRVGDRCVGRAPRDPAIVHAEHPSARRYTR